MSAPTQDILVIGATGRVGGATLRALVESGHAPTALVRGPERVEALPVPASCRIGDLADRASLADSMQGMDAMLLCSGHEPAMLEVQLGALAAAESVGMRRIVKISGSPASSFEGTPSAVVAQHLEIEAAVRRSGLEFTFIRPNAFTQLLAGYAGEIANGRLPLAFGAASVSWVDVVDVGAVAAAALRTDGPLPDVIDVTGPEALTGAELAAILADFTGTAVEYVELSDEQNRDRVRAVGAPDWLVEHVGTIFSLLRDRDGDRVTEAVEEWCGRPATSVAEVLAREGTELGIRAALSAVKNEGGSNE